MANYDQMTDTEFHAILDELVENMSLSQLMAIGDIRSILVEELNNEILDTWARRNPDKAYGEDPIDDEEDEEDEEI